MINAATTYEWERPFLSLPLSSTQSANKESFASVSDNESQKDCEWAHRYCEEIPNLYWQTRLKPSFFERRLEA